MKKGCLLIFLVVVGLIGLFAYGFLTAFDPVYDKAEIIQNIGGVLICNSVYNVDLHSGQYHVSYRYKMGNDSLVELGSGTYHDRQWDKDEQLIRYKRWTILKTGGWIGTDKVIIGELKTKQWKEYEFTPGNIEADSLWQNSKTQSLLNWCCSEAYIDTILNGQIVLHYKFRTSEKDVDKYGQRKIYYTINEATGQPVMTKIR